jgi:probable F420-dependent oxidoreductase
MEIPVRIGLVLPSKGNGAGPESLDAAAETATRLGWSSVWVTDHMYVARGDEADEYGWMLEALTTLAWVAARHDRLRLGTSVIVPAMRDAPQLAKELATIDVLSGGRLTVGVGVGDVADLPEWSNLGKADRMQVRGAYLDETIALWRHLWGGGLERFDGRFLTLDNYTYLPLPVQGGRLPIWSGGRSERAITRAATLCDGYHASQTGPTDLAPRIPALQEQSAAAGRPMPALSIRTRVRFDASPKQYYSLCGPASAMVDDLREFTRLGVEELVVVLEAVRPEDIAREAERFQREVVAPFLAAATADPT